MPPKKLSREKDLFLARCHHFQWVILFLNVGVITIGTCDLGLAFASRPILRLVDINYFQQVQSICDLLVASGFIQIVTAGLDILTTCSKRIRYLYISITVSVLAVLVEIAAVIAALYLLKQGTIVLAVDMLRPWFVWDCLPLGSCTSGLFYYINRFMMPQVGITALAIILHSLSILYLVKLFRAKKRQMDEMWRAKEKYRKREQDQLADAKEIEARAGFKENFAENNNLDSDAETEDIELQDRDHLQVEEQWKNARSPVSILKDTSSDHNSYVPSDAVDAEIDDNGNMRNRSKLRESHSCTFSANVEIHVMHSPEGLEDEEETKEYRTSHF